MVTVVAVVEVVMLAPDKGVRLERRGTSAGIKRAEGATKIDPYQAALCTAICCLTQVWCFYPKLKIPPHKSVPLRNEAGRTGVGGMEDGDVRQVKFSPGAVLHTLATLFQLSVMLTRLASSTTLIWRSVYTPIVSCRHTMATVTPSYTAYITPAS
ncbi:hypothetical protein E2C01_047157 [Portunus trituberculatus]|uniref:Uncharacterized protein n=1 Tax=Portunus trituberculatus TaxID=210409 RepID=A0A5B7G821_PORTR|nr:hypothetical protein [Portunus trituberculatus]